ncbi:NAD(P)/FAD-dependent oxidoreductase [Pseudonocardia abyssalis]|uniref:FAD-dependent oxidoreductase n=1 Tax=Pseudonocardia abyssalis TaxID=2792008 RepID=A0ABS6UT80_9PSEU|nr:FAD-dependent oxidoreductase [Pseudonocardia abyssalis]MBW0117258.1 FAD-dependent oxidoreductase [Pseudonocardia abyssalis]MBW0135420.1 FAD-dependent oxidoreductase [Pseudonocardia abyssalis]
MNLWFEQVVGDGDLLEPRPPLDGDADADVCIVGAGYTGLWTAHALLRADPGLRVVVVEREIAGFGASGRNGGWCSALFPAGPAALERRHGAGAAEAMGAAMRATVDDVGAAVAEEGIACDWVKGGTVTLARTAAQVTRARRDDGWVDAAQASALVGASGVLGATVTPDCARVQPARLVRGLARAVQRRGGRIAEGTRALSVGPRRVVTDRGVVTAGAVVRAAEAWNSGLAPRSVAPVYSLIVATRPLPASFWDVAGLAGGQTFTDHRHLIVYGQRTADDRLVFGGRGAPYHWRSRIRPEFDTDDRVFAGLRTAATDLFPALEPDDFTHAWGGPLGIPRDWHAGVGYSDGLGWAGGYVGDGVGTSHLAGRTLAALILGHDDPVMGLPWVGHRSRRWEPEPLRWLLVNAGLRLMTLADGEERLTRRPSVIAASLSRALGH